MPRPLSEIIAHIQTTMPHHGWLVRSDESGRFFANVSRNDWAGWSPQIDAMSHAYGDTPEEALETAIRGAVHLPSDTVRH